MSPLKFPAWERAIASVAVRQVRRSHRIAVIHAPGTPQHRSSADSCACTGSAPARSRRTGGVCRGLCGWHPFTPREAMLIQQGLESGPRRRSYAPLKPHSGFSVRGLSKLWRATRAKSVTI